MRAKAHIEFFVDYESINIFNIWIFSQHKIIKMRDVSFDENSFYKFNQINLAQLIKESFLTNSDTIEILRTNFTKIEKLSDIIDEENFQHILIDSINIIERDLALAQTSDEANSAKDDQQQEYLFSSTSSSLRNEKEYLATQTVFNTSSNTVKNRSVLDLMNILSEDFTRLRKSSWKAAYYSVLNETFMSDKEFFYAAFSASLIKIVSKNIRLHRDNLSSKFKYYKEMIKHSLASEFIQVIYIEIEAFQSKDTWKEMSHQHAQEAEKNLISTT